MAFVNTIPKWTMDETKWSNALDFYHRREKISDFYIDYEDMLRVTRAHPHVTYRYTVAPSTAPPVSGLIPIKATKEQIREEIQLGYDDGMKTIESARAHAAAGTSESID